MGNLHHSLKAQVNAKLRGTRVSALGILGLVAMLLVVAKDASAEVRFTYSSGVDQEHKRLLQTDLRVLSGLRFSDDSGETQRLMKLPNLNTSSMEGWLSKRARFILDENHSMGRSYLSALSDNADYGPKKLGPGGSGFNQVAEMGAGGDSLDATGPSPVAQPLRRSGGGRQIVMANIGTLLFYKARSSGLLASFQIQGGPRVALRSPRVGLLQIGPGLFTPFGDQKDSGDLEDFAHSVFRIGVLFHEARHSDGHGEHLGMTHTTCPIDHDFRGRPACDTATNGPYRIGALFTKAVIEACGPDCTTADKEALTVMYADSMSRLLNPVAGSNLAGRSKLCEALMKIAPHVPFCTTVSEEPDAHEWDDTPEYATPREDKIAMADVGT